MTDTRRDWVAALPAMVLPTFGALMYFVWLPGGAPAQAVYTGTKVFTIGWPLWWLGRSDWMAAVARRSSDLWLGLVSGLVVGGAIVVAYLAGADGLLAPHVEAIRGRATALGIGTPLAYVAFCAFLALVHSGIEEVYWRALVYRALARRLSRGMAIGLAALAFGAHHWVVLWVFAGPMLATVGTAGVALGGAWWCAMVDRAEGSLMGAWLSHALVDVGILVVGWLILFG